MGPFIRGIFPKNSITLSNPLFEALEGPHFFNGRPPPFDIGFGTAARIVPVGQFFGILAKDGRSGDPMYRKSYRAQLHPVQISAPTGGTLDQLLPSPESVGPWDPCQTVGLRPGHSTGGILFVLVRMILRLGIFYAVILGNFWSSITVMAKLPTASTGDCLAWAAHSICA